MSDPFESLLEQMIPGTGGDDAEANDPIFPKSLGLQPLGVLGRGGAGVVYRARDPFLEREVAVKISRKDGGAAVREMMLREARLTSRLQHAAVLPVHRVTAGDGHMCIVYQLAPVTTLEALLGDARAIQDGTWSLERRMRTLLQVGGAIAHAHQLGIHHGDLHPGNVVVGAGGEPYVLDWSGGMSGPGQLSGRPAYASPEQLMGDLPTMASDVFALGAMAWELATLRPLRRPHRGEDLGTFVRRLRGEPLPEPPQGMDPDLAEMCAVALTADPAARPTAQEIHDRLHAILSGRAVRDRRTEEAAELMVQSRDALIRYEELAKQIVEENTVVTVQRAKVPGHAPVPQKKSLWEAEDRVARLTAQRYDAWLDAVEGATRVTTLAPLQATAPRTAARQVLAKLWWERMREAEAAHDVGDARRCERWVRVHDDGHFTHLLESDAHVSLSATVPGATVAIHRIVEQDRILRPVHVDTVALPLTRHPLRPGSWLLRVSAEGYETADYPLLLGRLDHHQGQVALYTPDQVGEGWVQIPAGRYRLGGDPRARQPLDACSPFLSDRFVQRTCVRARDWLAFLDDIDLDTARQHVPGEAGLFGSGGRSYWEHDGKNWVLPEQWHPDWPAFSVNLADIEAYARWLSGREGRPIRLPTEEEWEKAARGVDGRPYPWGHHFDPTFAHMRQSRASPPAPHPVADYPVDTSIYGCRDMAGGVRELTSSVFDVGQMVIRGGTWGDDADDLRCANRAGLRPEFRYAFIGFRLITEAPRP